MERYCEIFADGLGRLRVVFVEFNKVYGDYTSPILIPEVVGEAYKECGPFGKRSGAINRLRVV